MNPWPAALRAPVKLVLFALIVAFVLYPRVWLLPEWVARLRDMERVLDPRHPGLAWLEQAVRERAGAQADAATILKTVQAVVYERIPYAWDWDVWGVMDYLPTVSEALAQGREDCDGRAVVAASLLRRMGYQAALVSDLQHTWVSTPAGDTLSPGRGSRTLRGEKGGTRAQLALGSLENLGRAGTFGIAVFPLFRELIILAALCCLSLRPGVPALRVALGCGLLILALALLRACGSMIRSAAAPPLPMAIAASGAALLGWIVLRIRAGRSPARSGAAPIE